MFYTAAFFLALGLAEDHQQSIALGLVNYLWPALTILFSLPLLHARATWVLVPGTLLGLAGMAVVLSQGQSIPLAAVPEALGRNPLAFACALAAAVFLGAVLQLGAALGRCAFGGRRAVVRARGGRGLLTGDERTSSGSRLFYDSGDCRGRANGPHGAGCLCLLGIGRCGRATCGLVSACSYLTPLLSTLVAAAYLRVTPPAGLWLGCAALVAGSLASWWAVEHRAA